MRIGIYPGSFNPFHAGHLELVNKLLDENIVDHIIICPTGEYWHKTDLPDQWKRCKFIQDVLTNTGSNIQRRIHTWVIQEPYIYELLKKVEELDKDAIDDNSKYYLIIGADNVDHFDQWHEYNKIVDEYGVIVVGRGDKPDLGIFKDVQYIEYNNPISATNIRQMIKNGVKEAYGIDYSTY